jgi:hypothetical protein
MVTRTHLNITLHVHCLSCLLLCKTVQKLKFRSNNRGNALSVHPARLMQAYYYLYWYNDKLEKNRVFQTATLREIPAIHRLYFVLVAFLHNVRGESRSFREQQESDFLRLIKNPTHESHSTPSFVLYSLLALSATSIRSLHLLL